MEYTLYLLIIILQLQVLAWTVADHTVTIATHSQHKSEFFFQVNISKY